MVTMAATDARLLAIDWGSTSLRACRLGEGGVLLDERRSAEGASTLGGDPVRFELALRSVLGDWLQHQPYVPALACGMVGSAHGWREAPYAECPVGIAELHRHAVTVDWAGGLLRILPGLACSGADGTPDVMRGEETQIAGALALHPALAGGATIVLPGTHSKWARLQGGVVARFETRMTGELYAVLRQHSVLGKLMTPVAGFDGEAFDRGLDAARQDGGADLLRRLFATRTLGLFGRCPPEGLADHLSGLLIGTELVAGLAAADPQQPLVLVGEPALCARYRHALARLGRPADLHIDQTAPAGLWQQAVAAGWAH